MKKDGSNAELDVYSFMTTAPNALAPSFDPGSMRIVQSGFEKKDLVAA